MLTTKNLYVNRWFTPRESIAILKDRFGVISGVPRLYRILRNHGIIDAENLPVPPYDNGDMIRVREIKIASRRTGRAIASHNKLFIKGAFFETLSRILNGGQL